MKLLLCLTNSLTFRDNALLLKYSELKYISPCIALTAQSSMSQLNYMVAVNEGFSDTKLGFSFTDENVLPHESHSLYL